MCLSFNDPGQVGTELGTIPGHSGRDPCPSSGHRDKPPYRGLSLSRDGTAGRARQGTFGSAATYFRPHREGFRGANVRPYRAREPRHDVALPSMDRSVALTVLRRLAAAGSLRPSERAELMRAIAAIAKPTTRIEHLALLEAQMAHLPAAERMRTISERLGISRATYFRLKKNARASLTA